MKNCVNVLCFIYYWQWLHSSLSFIVFWQIQFCCILAYFSAAAAQGRNPMELIVNRKLASVNGMFCGYHAQVQVKDVSHSLLSVCPDHRGVVGFMVCPNYHLLTTIWFCWLPPACWLHCVFSVGLLGYQANKKHRHFRTKICLVADEYQTTSH